MASAYFAGGCFWCVTPAFRAAGAKKVTCGFSGGTEADPTYKEVKSQLTGHRETVRVDYDPVAVPYGRLVDIFLESVDPFHLTAEGSSSTGGSRIPLQYISPTTRRR